MAVLAELELAHSSHRERVVRGSDDHLVFPYIRLGV